MARQRSPERAKAVLDRAARMQSFRPSRADQRANDPQMRTPGKHTKALNVNDLPASAFKKVGKQSVNPRDIVTDQPTVSRAQVKAKIDRMASGEKVSVRLIQRPDGKFQMLDGNHGATAARALGRNVEAEIFKVSKGGPAPAGKPLSALTKIGLTATAIAPVVAGTNAYNAKIAAGGSKTEAMGEAIQQGTVAGAGALTATGLMAGMAKAAQMVAPKVAPVLGPAGLALGLGMSAYGAYKGYQNTGTVSGALKGAIGIDTAKADTPDGRGAPIGADPTTMAIANPTTPGQSRGLGGDSATKGSISGEKTATGGSKFESANTSFSQDRAAKEKQQEQSTESGDGEKQRGWGWKARAASAKSRGIQEWNHPEE